jgi:hypothetical protein
MMRDLVEAGLMKRESCRRAGVRKKEERRGERRGEDGDGEGRAG